MSTHHETPPPIRSSSDMFDAITKLLEEDGGVFGLSYSIERQEWMVAIEWGREAPDSPMAGAAAYVIDSVPAAAVEAALREAGR